MKRQSHSASEAQENGGPCQKPPSEARGSWVHQQSNGFRWSKLLALVPGAERSRCGLFGLLGHLERCKRSVDGSDVPHPVSELTTCPRLGEDCWSRGLQSACFWQVAGWRVVHSGASLVDEHRFAPLLRLGNRDLHALPWPPSRSKVGCLACVRVITLAAIAAASTAAHTASNHQRSAPSRAPQPPRG